MHGVTLATTLLRYTPVPTAVMVAAVKGTVTSLEGDRPAHMMNTEDTQTQTHYQQASTMKKMHTQQVCISSICTQGLKGLNHNRCAAVQTVS